MAYQPQIWNNGQAGGTPVSAGRLNYMESGIERAHDLIEGQLVIEKHITRGNQSHATAIRNITWDISIPGSWNTWEISTMGTANCLNNNMANGRGVTGTWFFDGVQAPGSMLVRLAASSPDSARAASIAQQGFWGPKSGTGTKSGRWQLESDVATGTVETNAVDIRVRARRLS